MQAEVLPNMFGAETCSLVVLPTTYSMFIDGKKLNLPAALAKRYTNDPNAGGTALGDLSNSNVSKFIIGGFNNI
jgi:hypothetical protein